MHIDAFVRFHIFVTMTLQCNLESGTMVPIAPLFLLRYFGYLGSFVITFVFLFYFGEEWSFDEDHTEHDSGVIGPFFIFLILGFMSMGNLYIFLYLFYVFSSVLFSFHSRDLCSLCLSLFLSI